jgi:hypothetical protein
VPELRHGYIKNDFDVRKWAAPEFLEKAARELIEERWKEEGDDGRARSTVATCLDSRSRMASDTRSPLRARSASSVVYVSRRKVRCPDRDTAAVLNLVARCFPIVWTGKQRQALLITWLSSLSLPSRGTRHLLRR